jgi:hypothetical protein
LFECFEFPFFLLPFFSVQKRFLRMITSIFFLFFTFTYR